MASRQHRLNPSKLLVLLLYGTYPYMDVKTLASDSKEVELDVGKFARLLRVRNSNIVEYLEWLENMSFITLCKCDNKKATVILTLPTLFQEVG